MTENEIVTQKDSQTQMFAQLMQGTLKKLERYCLAARPMLGGEVYLTGEDVCSLLRLHFKTIGTAERLPIAKSEARYSTGKATYKPCSKGTITQYARRKANKTCRKKS